jgi:hypothetical protein
MRVRDLVGVLAIVASACGGSQAVRDAEAGRYPQLRAELDAKVRAYTMSNREAADVAMAVASREVKVAQKADATQRVRDVRACAFALDDVLAERMKTQDEAGAEAAQARLEDGRLDADDARGLAASPDAAWRAVGTRALTRAEDRGARLRALVDPSPGVRRAAVHATSAAARADGADLDPLFEAARLDPEPLVRTDAVRAIGRLAPGRLITSARVAGRLQDLWIGADDPLREDIAAAWAMPAVLGAGGREALRTLLAQETGPGVLAGAGAILRSNVQDAELTSSATAVLARAIRSSVRRDCLHAIAVAPLAGSPGAAVLREAMRKASDDDDSAVRLGALARLTEQSADRQSAMDRLEGMAQNASPDVRARARLALASAGDARVQAWLVADLGDTDPQVRLEAARALAMLGVAGRGAPLLADPDPGVRTRAACSVLLAVRGR